MVFLGVFLLVLKTGYELGAGIYTGLKLATENIDEFKKIKGQEKRALAFTEGDFRIVNLVPTMAMFQPDSILNMKTEKNIPVVYTQMMTQVSPNRNITHSVLSAVFQFLGFIAIILTLVFFIKLIISINRSEIFEWKNVKRLRIMGWALLISFFCTMIPSLMDLLTAMNAIQLKDYAVSPAVLDNLSDLFLALGCLVVAETFAIALKMKEEQDLTI